MIHRYILMLEIVQRFAETYNFIHNLNTITKSNVEPKVCTENQPYIHYKYYSSGVTIISVGRIKMLLFEEEDLYMDDSYEYDYNYDEFFNITVLNNVVPLDLYNDILNKCIEYHILVI